ARHAITLVRRNGFMAPALWRPLRSPVPEMNVGSLADARCDRGHAFHALVSARYGKLYAPRAANVIVETSNTKFAQDFTKSMPPRPCGPAASDPKSMLSARQEPPPIAMSNGGERQRRRST